MKKRVFWKLIRNVLIIVLFTLVAGRIGYGTHNTQEACLKWRVTEASCMQYFIEAESQGKHLKWVGK